MWFKILWVSLGGACGAVSRFLVSEAMAGWLGDKFPWGTLTVNMLGSLLMGFLFALTRDQLLTNDHARLFLMVGFLGSFTTFSSFALDNVGLLRSQSASWMFLNIGIQNVCGVLFALLGIWWGGRWLS